MRILFCRDDLEPRKVDACFAEEAAAAANCGLVHELIDLGALRKGRCGPAVASASGSGETETGVYRGWMLTPDEYTVLHRALEQRGIRLVNSPEEYLHCHWLPHSYPTVRECTPLSVWLPSDGGFLDFRAVMEALSCFGSSAVLVKDYVKSQKHAWFDACFIRDASDESEVRRVTKRFLELQGEDLQGGLVFRKFVELEVLGTHPKSGTPVVLEYRLFVLDGTVIASWPYWDANYPAESPPVEQFAAVLRKVRSRFFSCDVAKAVDDRWLIVELGDGQVSGLPPRSDATQFYRSLSTRLCSKDKS